MPNLWLRANGRSKIKNLDLCERYCKAVPDATVEEIEDMIIDFHYAEKMGEPPKARFRVIEGGGKVKNSGDEFDPKTMDVEI